MSVFCADLRLEFGVKTIARLSAALSRQWDTRLPGLCFNRTKVLMGAGTISLWEFQSVYALRPMEMCITAPMLPFCKRVTLLQHKRPTLTVHQASLGAFLYKWVKQIKMPCDAKLWILFIMVTERKQSASWVSVMIDCFSPLYDQKLQTAFNDP